MEILLVPNEVLRLKAQKLTKITKEDINIAHQMMNTMIKAPGVGLAANQVGILKQIATINIRFNDLHTAETLIEWIDDKIETVFTNKIKATCKVRHEISARSFLNKPGQLSKIISKRR